ncbi:MAG: hypothetical protein HQM13_12335 [SAR324 cluster bacterium]|nr:hypothetical protein [SAR324 cluster bacterium]
MKMKRLLIGLLMMIPFLPGCSKIQDLANPFLSTKPEVVVCASAVIDQAYDLYGEAKIELAQHYDNRDANHLFKAYYAASDSMTLARSVKNCKDRQSADFFAMKNLLDLNLALQSVVRINMRDEDPSDLIAIYREQYYKVMPNDIR